MAFYNTVPHSALLFSKMVHFFMSLEKICLTLLYSTNFDLLFISVLTENNVCNCCSVLISNNILYFFQPTSVSSMQLKLLSSNSLNTFSNPKLQQYIFTDSLSYLDRASSFSSSCKQDFSWFHLYSHFHLSFLTGSSTLRLNSLYHLLQISEGATKPDFCFLFSSSNGGWGKELPLSVIRVALCVS